MPIAYIKRFFLLEGSSGIILLCAALLGLLLENSPWRHEFVAFYSRPLFILTHGHFPESLLGIVNNGLMTLFFLNVSLEIKREMLEGELSSFSKAILPIIAAVGGMLVPALIYVVFNYNHPDHLPGWAIPTATDIAFSLAVLSLLGKSIPANLRTFLLALALFDDLGAILIIAIFYTYHLSFYGYLWQ